MVQEIFKISDEDTLKADIGALRDILNELCCTIDDSVASIEQLTVSRRLDKLIIEYMTLKK